MSVDRFKISDDMMKKFVDYKTCSKNTTHGARNMIICVTKGLILSESSLFISYTSLYLRET